MKNIDERIYEAKLALDQVTIAYSHLLKACKVLADAMNYPQGTVIRKATSPKADQRNNPKFIKDWFTDQAPYYTRFLKEQIDEEKREESLMTIKSKLTEEEITLLRGMMKKQ